MKACGKAVNIIILFFVICADVKIRKAIAETCGVGVFNHTAGVCVRESVSGFVQLRRQT